SRIPLNKPLCVKWKRNIFQIKPAPTFGFYGRSGTPDKTTLARGERWHTSALQNQLQAISRKLQVSLHLISTSAHQQISTSAHQRICANQRNLRHQCSIFPSLRRMATRTSP